MIDTCEWCINGKCRILPSKEPCSYKNVHKKKEEITQAIINLENEINNETPTILKIDDKKELIKAINKTHDKMQGIKTFTETLEKNYQTFIKPNHDLYKNYIKIMLLLKKIERKQK